MKKRKSIIGVCVMIALVFSTYIISDSSKEIVNVKDNKDIMQYESRENFDIIYCDYDELLNKMELGDIRALNQDNYDEWETQAKNLYTKWYDVGHIPEMPAFEDYKVNVYEVATDMLAISYTDSYVDNTNYYDVITLPDDVRNMKLDIEKYYDEYLTYQKEVIADLGGCYVYWEINGENTKVAMIEYEDNTISVDFIWDGIYWVRMWDLREYIEHHLNNFHIETNNIQKPDGFDDENFEKHILLPTAETTIVNNSEAEISTYSLAKTVASDFTDTNINILGDETFKIELNGKYGLNYELDYKDVCVGDMIDYIQYHYKNIETNEEVVISISSNKFESDRISNYASEYINMFNSNNPYRYDKELAEKYGVYKVTSDENINYYNICFDNNNCVITYSKQGNNYSEYITLVDERFVKVSCNKELAVWDLKQICDNITILTK